VKGGEMDPIRSLKELVDRVRGQRTMTLAVAAGEDPHTIEATHRGAKEGLVKVVLVGNKASIEKVAKEHGVDVGVFEIIHEEDPVEAGRIARDMVRKGEAQILMKGLIPTDRYMKLILDKENGLLPPGRILSHIAVMETPKYPKLLFVADVAVIPLPDLRQKIAMLNYCIEVAHLFGIECPKAAIIAATEQVSDKMPATLDAAIIAKMAQRGQIKGAIVDGPLALDVAISKEACEIKKLKSEVGGDADILIFPNIETGNVFFKSITKIAGGELAAMVTGAMAPCVLTSRADTEESKFYSIALAALVAGGKE